YTFTRASTRLTSFVFFTRKLLSKSLASLLLYVLFMKGIFMRLPLKHYQDLLVKYLKPQWSLALLLLILLLINMGLALVNPQVIRAFIDSVSSRGAMSTLIELAL